MHAFGTLLAEDHPGGVAYTAGRAIVYVAMALVLFLVVRGIYRGWVRNQAGIRLNDEPDEPKA